MLYNVYPNQWTYPSIQKIIWKLYGDSHSQFTYSHSLASSVSHTHTPLSPFLLSVFFPLSSNHRKNWEGKYWMDYGGKKRGGGKWGDNGKQMGLIWSWDLFFSLCVCVSRRMRIFPCMQDEAAVVRGRRVGKGKGRDNMEKQGNGKQGKGRNVQGITAQRDGYLTCLS